MEKDFMTKTIKEKNDQINEEANKNRSLGNSIKSKEDKDQHMINESVRSLNELLKERIRELESEINELNKKLDDAKNTKDQIKEDKEFEVKQSLKSKNELKDCMKLMEEKNEEIPRLRKKLERQDGDNNRNNDVVNKKNETIERLNEEVKESSDRILLMTREMTERNNLISELNIKVKELLKDEEDRLDELEGRRKQVELLEKYKDEQEAELNDRNNSQDEDNSNLKNKLYAKEEEINAMKSVAPYNQIIYISL